MHALLISYETTSEEALTKIYDGDQKGLLSIIEDMYSAEAEIIAVDSVLLTLLAE